MLNIAVLIENPIKQHVILDDHQIVEAIRLGGNSKRNAIEQFFTMHQNMMYKIKNKLNLSNDSIKDMYADAISSVIWNIDTNKFKGGSKLSTYLYKIFYNKSVDHLRHISSNKNVAYLELNENNSVSTINDTRKLEIKLDVETVKKEIQELGDPCKNIIIEWAYWGYNMSEIAQRNGLENAEKAKKKKYSCLQKLRGILKAKSIY